MASRPRRVGHTDLLRQFGIARNPFVDRTAEKTSLDDVSLLIASDLRGFKPSSTSYVFFGKRGSGKTTIRMMMQEAYAEHNAAERAAGRSRGAFVVDLARPGLLAARLRAFQASIGATDDNWDAAFAENWSTSDLVDCIASSVATELASEMTDPGSVEGSDMAARAAADPRVARQVLLLAHLYADCDSATLAALRGQLLKPRLAKKLAVGAAAVGAGAAAAVVLKDSETVADAWERIADEVDDSMPFIAAHPRLIAGVVGVAAAAVAWATARARRRSALERAAAVQAPVRVVKPRPLPELAALLGSTFSAGDTAEAVRSLALGTTPGQRLDRLQSLLRTLGFEALAVFGDCFDEVSLLDPGNYPSAQKVWAREACKNSLLNAGRVHLFFPETRLALDLSTDRAAKEARFDRHFVRDLTWSRHQLEELARRRFLAAQLAAQRAAAAALGEGGTGAGSPRAGADAVAVALEGGNGGRPTHFEDLFAGVKPEDLSSVFSKISTPRELLIMCSELFSRIESQAGTGESTVTAQDLEIAAQRALEQAV